MTLMGLGLLGRGVGDAVFLALCGAEVTVTDLKTEEELKESVEKLRGIPGIKFKLGGHDLADFQNCDMVLKAAGVPLDSIYIAEARKNNIPVYMGAALFTKLAPEVTVVGITGTRGKSTVTHLIAHILKTAGKNVLLGGNVRDVATLPMLRDARSGDIVVMELDSWQLQGFADAGISPHVAVFTTFMDDHMNYYEGDREKYFNDKAAIYRYQKETDTLVVGEDVVSVIASRDKHKGNLVIAKRGDVPKEWKVKIPGEHNLLNIVCAVEACRSLGISDEEIKKGVESFAGVEGRLQFVKEVKGVKIYNDGNATTPEATVAGLRAVESNRNIILVMGGTDKGLDITPLLDEIGKSAKAIVFFRESGTDKIKDRLVNIKGVQAVETETFEESVRKGFELASVGDVLLFSPAFASFGRFFKNEYDRSDQFIKIINQL